MALRPVQIKHLKNLLQIGSNEQVIHAIEKVHPSDMSVLFTELSDSQIKRLVDCLFMLQKAAKTLKEMPEFLLPDILELIDSDKLAIMLTRIDADDAAYLLEKIPETRWQKVLNLLDPQIRLPIEKLMLYPPESAGSVMNPAFFFVHAGTTVGQTIKQLQKFSEKESVFYIYVVDNKRLVGVVPLRTLVIADPKRAVDELMTTDVIMVNAASDQEEAAQMVSQYNLLAIPVVNDNKELLGVIAVDDVIDIFEQEATEDLYNIAGLSGEDRAFTPVATKIKRRLPWLMINLGTAFLAAMVVGLFEKTIQNVAILAAYMPVVAGLGGNTGTQSMVVITRSIALGEMAFSRVYQPIFKEVVNGLVLGVVAGLIAAGISWIVNIKPFLGVILFFSMVINMVLAGLVGATVPFFLKWLKRDPAIGAGVFVTAMTDMTGFFVFLGLAQLFVKRL